MKETAKLIKTIHSKGEAEKYEFKQSDMLMALDLTETLHGNLLRRKLKLLYLKPLSVPRSKQLQTRL